MSKGPKPRFRNYYKCSECGAEWQDEWDCTCNDRCPKCDAEIEPYKSDDLDKLDVFKRNVIEVAKHHRGHCHEPCNCSLFLLRELAEKAGIEFDDEEKKLFL